MKLSNKSRGNKNKKKKLREILKSKILLKKYFKVLFCFYKNLISNIFVRNQTKISCAVINKYLPMEKIFSLYINNTCILLGKHA